MKTTKIITIATLITVITIMLCGTVMTAHAEETEVFELQGLVTGYEEYFDCMEYTVTLEDGTMLAFYAEAGDFRLGDLVWLDVFMGKEPEVLEVYFVTTLDWDEMFRWLDRVYD